MSRIKGSPKYGGRVKGTPNRTSEEVRQSLLKLLDDNLSKLQKDIDGMKGKDRASLLISLAKHIIPPGVNPEKLTEDQLLQIIQYLRENEKHT
jgi:hypothetical protein